MLTIILKVAPEVGLTEPFVKLWHLKCCSAKLGIGVEMVMFEGVDTVVQHGLGEKCLLRKGFVDESDGLAQFWGRLLGIAGSLELLRPIEYQHGLQLWDVVVQSELEEFCETEKRVLGADFGVHAIAAGVDEAEEGGDNSRRRGFDCRLLSGSVRTILEGQGQEGACILNETRVNHESLDRPVRLKGHERRVPAMVQEVKVRHKPS